MDLPDRVRHPSAIAVDIGVVAIVAVPTVLDAWWNEEGTRQADVWTYVLVVASLAALLFRRRWPHVVALASGAALSGLYLLGHHGELLNLPVIVALYTVATSGTLRGTVITGVVASAWSGILGATSDDPLGARGSSPVLEMMWPLVPLALGEAVRSRRELAARAAADREREAAERLQAERGRVARELHDVVAHTMSAVNVQMAAAAAAFDDRPDLARVALEQARESSREAFRELRMAVGLLREQADLAPAPRLDGLDDLAASVRAAGIDVTVRDERDGVVLGDAAELAAYRIVQEALTNTVRHSNARHAAVSLTTDAQHLIIEVVDDGTGAATAGATAAGLGLRGMGERVEALAGTLDHGATPTGGFRVHAVIPIGESRR